MTKLTIKASDGKEYPCRVTLGAMIQFKRKTGKDISETNGSFEEMALFLYLCVVSACAADHIDFGYTFEEFSDHVDVGDMNSFNASMQEEQTQDGDSKKKKSQ